MSIRKNVQDILVPSEERHIKMYPMDFEEFLWAMDNDMLMDIVQKCFEAKKPMFDKLEVNKGMIIENIVAQMLAASGHR